MIILIDMNKAKEKPEALRSESGLSSVELQLGKSKSSLQLYLNLGKLSDVYHTICTYHLYFVPLLFKVARASSRA